MRNRLADKRIQYICSRYKDLPHTMIRLRVEEEEGRNKLFLGNNPLRLLDLQIRKRLLPKPKN